MISWAEKVVYVWCYSVYVPLMGNNGIVNVINIGVCMCMAGTYSGRRVAIGIIIKAIYNMIYSSFMYWLPSAWYVWAHVNDGGIGLELKCASS